MNRLGIENQIDGNAINQHIVILFLKNLPMAPPRSQNPWRGVSCLSSVRFNTMTLALRSMASYAIARAEPPAPRIADPLSRYLAMTLQCISARLCRPYCSQSSAHPGRMIVLTEPMAAEAGRSGVRYFSSCSLSGRVTLKSRKRKFSHDGKKKGTRNRNVHLT